MTEEEMGHENERREQSGGDGDTLPGVESRYNDDPYGVWKKGEAGLVNEEEGQEVHWEEVQGTPPQEIEARLEESIEAIHQGRADDHPERKEDHPGEGGGKGGVSSEGISRSGRTSSSENARKSLEKGSLEQTDPEFMARFRDREGCTVGSSWVVVHGDSELVVRYLEVVDHVITDPPYSDFVHRNAAGSHRATLVDGNGHRSNASVIRRTDLGFQCLDPATQLLMAREWARLTRRWSLIFADEEGGGRWRDAIRHYPATDYVRTVCWDRDNTGSPQFTGDRPAIGHEVIVCSHRRGKKSWNGGGKRGIYRFPVVLNYGSGAGREVDGRREHTTQKPLDLMLALVTDFTDPGDLILDPFAGSGTTGVAALRLGRRCILIEKDPKYAAICVERMRAEDSQSTLAAMRAGQVALWPNP